MPSDKIKLIIKNWKQRIKDPFELDIVIDEIVEKLNFQGSYNTQFKDDGLIISSIFIVGNKWEKAQGIEVELNG